MTNGPPRDELEELFDELGELHELRAAVQKEVLAHDIKQAMSAGRGGSFAPPATSRLFATADVAARG